MATKGTCPLCGNVADLKESHVLPKFVFKWLKRRSGTGHIRFTENPNQRVQDGLKFRWLCGSCETLLSRYETAFANKFFHPLVGGIGKVSHSDWLLPFCVSVSWRVLKFARGLNPENTYTHLQEQRLGEAEARWRGFLNGACPHPGEFEQHLVVFDIMEDSSIGDLPPNINRFLTGAVTLDIVGSADSLMTFAKLGRFCIFGIVQKGLQPWEGTKVHVKNGVWKPGKFTLPGGVLHMLVEKASIAGEAMQGISDTQLSKIEDSVLRNRKAFMASEQYRAIEADAAMFGPRALSQRKSKRSTDR